MPDVQCRGVCFDELEFAVMNPMAAMRHITTTSIQGLIAIITLYYYIDIYWTEANLYLCPPPQNSYFLQCFILPVCFELNPAYQNNT